MRMLLFWGLGFVCIFASSEASAKSRSRRHPTGVIIEPGYVGCENCHTSGITFNTRGLSDYVLRSQNQLDAFCPFDHVQSLTRDPAEARCGNGTIEGNEACDGANLDGKKCDDFGEKGRLRCSPKCTFDRRGCRDLSQDVESEKKVLNMGIREEDESCNTSSAIPSFLAILIFWVISKRKGVAI